MPTGAPSAASSRTTSRMSSIHSGAKARSSSPPGRVGLSPDAALVDADHAVARGGPAPGPLDPAPPGPDVVLGGHVDQDHPRHRPRPAALGQVGRLVDQPDDAVGAEPGDPLAHGRGPVRARSRPAPRWSASGRLDRHGGVVGDPRGQPAHDLVAARPRGRSCSSGGTSSSWSWPVAGPVSSRSCSSRSAIPGGTGRSVRVSSSTRSASGRSAGSLPRSRARSSLAVVGVVLEAGRVPEPVVGCLEGGLAEAVERLALAQEGAAGQARVPADQRAERPGRLRRRPAPAASVAPSRMPTAATPGAPRSSRYWRAASMLASQAGTRSGSSCRPAESPVPS